MYDIEKSIPIPMETLRKKRKQNRHADQKHKLDQMEVGDSFVTPGEKANSTHCRELNRAKLYGRRTGKKFRARMIGGNTVMVWREE